MKRLIVYVALVCLANQAQAGWFDWLTGGDDKDESASTVVQEEAAPVLSGGTATAAAMGLIPDITDSLGVTETQAGGGVGSLLQVAQGTLSGDEFSALSGYIPDSADLLSMAPAIAGDSAVGSALKTAGQYSESMKMAGQVAAQFEALGLDPALAAQYIVKIQSFLQSTGGQAAVDLFTKGVAALA